jgi:hypothetical protein
MKSITLFLALFFIITHPKGYSQNLPKEWIMLFDCIHTNQKKISPDIFTILNTKISQLNASLNFIPPERVTPFMKALLYRHLLERPPVTASKNLRSIVFIEKFFSDYEKKYKTQSCSFTNWIIESMQNDFRSIQQSGGFLEDRLNANSSPLKAKGITIQQYISQWIDFLQSSLDDKESLIINYYAKVVIAAENTVKVYSLFAPPQPTTITYINWTFSSTFSDSKTLIGPVEEVEKSAAEILEKNVPSPPSNEKTKSEAIDELIQKKKKKSENPEEL